MADVIVVGGGAIGLSVAYHLAEQGAQVKLLERGQIGQEASWAGAGILPPGNFGAAKSPLDQLRAYSSQLWPGLSEKLKAETGVDNGYLPCAAIEFKPGEADLPKYESELAGWLAEDVPVQMISVNQVKEYEPAINSPSEEAFRLPTLTQVRNPRHLKAMRAACALRGVQLLEETPVTGFEINQQQQVIAVNTPGGKMSADAVCVASGSWTQRLLSAVGSAPVITPIRGQIALLEMPVSPIRHVIHHGTKYLVPRPDGLVLVGSTTENAGFNKNTTAAVIADLLNFAIATVPELAKARLTQTWAGLRPQSGDDLPYMGLMPGCSNLYVASGHYRWGLQQSPVTGLLMSQLITGQKTAIPLEPFACDRKLGSS